MLLLKKGSILSQHDKKLIYLIYVIPILTYAAPVRCTMAITHINKLQQMQNKHGNPTIKCNSTTQFHDPNIKFYKKTLE